MSRYNTNFELLNPFITNNNVCCKIEYNNMIVRGTPYRCQKINYGPYSAIS